MSKLPSYVTNAACYLRKSREDEEAERRGEDTLQRQRELMVRDILPQYNLNYEILEEVASGDSIRNRPVFKNLLPNLGTKYQAIICKDLSRLGRGSYSDMGIVYDIIRDRRIFIITKDTVYDPHNFSDLRMIRFSLFFNREEYEMTIWRLTEGKYDGASRGKWVAGSVPFGFAYNSKLQILEPVESEADIVRLIFHLYGNEQLGYQAISSQLHKLGIASPRGRLRWHPEVIRRILQNVAYKGTLAFRKTQRTKHDGRVVQRPKEEHIIIDHAFEAIIGEELWWKVDQRIHHDRAVPPVKIEYEPTELAGLVTCATCHKKMIRQSSQRCYQRRDGGVSRYERAFMYCPNCGYSVKYHDCKMQLLTILHSLSPINGLALRTYIDQRQKELKELTIPASRPSSQGQNLENQRAIIESRLVKARELLLDGTFSREEYLAAKEKCVSELQAVNDVLTLYQEDHLAADEMLEYVPQADLSNHTLREFYDALSDHGSKNRLLHAIFNEVQLERKHKGTGKRNPTQFDLHVKLAEDLFV